MSHSRPHTATPQAYTIEFIPGRIDSPEDFPRPSVYLESTVAARSSYLLTKLNPPFDGYNIPRVELSSANPKGFKLYAKWLEAGYLAFPTSDVLPTGSVPHNSLSWSECEVLVKAHILGSQFGDELFQDQVMNEMIRWLKPDQGVDWGICKMVFGKQASGVSQKLQCLVVDRMFADEMEGDKLLSLFMKRRLAGRIGDLELGETCEYHVHEEGNQSLNRGTSALSPISRGSLTISKDKRPLDTPQSSVIFLHRRFTPVFYETSHQTTAEIEGAEVSHHHGDKISFSVHQRCLRVFTHAYSKGSRLMIGFSPKCIKPRDLSPQAHLIEVAGRFVRRHRSTQDLYRHLHPLAAQQVSSTASQHPSIRQSRKRIQETAHFLVPLIHLQYQFPSHQPPTSKVPHTSSVENHSQAGLHRQYEYLLLRRLSIQSAILLPLHQIGNSRAGPPTRQGNHK
ncbi:hypothetical protein K458DRAFT_385028 [Lentithecium fluviatile CBS 122367]|uniref:BTB domain-containing protein n=1 Tax=Lentithecium fluviatile CBS 122367 TaxID=1168545 RepID=A0A6G1JE70_9PLEO|nr:hypothetical protein K458DRAFT_385028 [Lentithecium fluviatile CBS 122367]